MQLRDVTKPTDANFVRAIRKTVQSIKVVTSDSIGTCSSGLYTLPFETSGAGSCGTTGIHSTGFSWNWKKRAAW